MDDTEICICHSEKSTGLPRLIFEDSTLNDSVAFAALRIIIAVPTRDAVERLSRRLKQIMCGYKDHIGYVTGQTRSEGSNSSKICCNNDDWLSCKKITL